MRILSAEEDKMIVVLSKEDAQALGKALDVAAIAAFCNGGANFPALGLPRSGSPEAAAWANKWLDYQVAMKPLLPELLDD